MSDLQFAPPKSPLGSWDQLSKNEKAWIEMIRVISNGTNPKLTLDRLRALTDLLS
jgi:hypothetical protein